jgi:hypothetical protein
MKTIILNDGEKITTKKLNYFINYVYSYYGPGEIFNDIFMKPLTKEIIKEAALIQIEKYNNNPIHSGCFEWDARETIPHIVVNLLKWTEFHPDYED